MSKPNVAGLPGIGLTVIVAVPLTVPAPHELVTETSEYVVVMMGLGTGLKLNGVTLIFVREVVVEPSE